MLCVLWILALAVAEEVLAENSRSGKQFDVPGSGVPLLYQPIPPAEPTRKQAKNVNQYQVAFILPPGQPQHNYAVSPGNNGVWVNVPLNPYKPIPTTIPTAEPVPTASYTQSPPVTKPETDDLLRWCLQPTGQFPSRYCNKFVNCWDGNAIEQFCPPTLVFNPKGYCDYAYNVDCQGKPIQPFPTAPVVEGGWPTDGSYIPPVTAEPSPPVTAYPTGPPTSGPINTYPTPAPPAPVIATQPTTPSPAEIAGLKKYCLKPRGQFAYIICSKFVNCWDDVVILQDCPEGLHFNAAKGYCDFPHGANCNKKENPPKPTLYHSENPCPEASGVYRNATNCAAYYICENYRIVSRQQCPSRYLFNHIIGACDVDYRVDCGGNAPLPHPAAFNLPAAAINPSLMCRPGTVFRLNDECTQVTLCRDGFTEIVECPPGLSYDVVSDKCVDPKHAKC